MAMQILAMKKYLPKSEFSVLEKEPGGGEFAMNGVCSHNSGSSAAQVYVRVQQQPILLLRMREHIISWELETGQFTGVYFSKN